MGLNNEEKFANPDPDLSYHVKNAANVRRKRFGDNATQEVRWGKGRAAAILTYDKGQVVDVYLIKVEPDSSARGLDATEGFRRAMREQSSTRETVNNLVPLKRGQVGTPKKPRSIWDQMQDRNEKLQNTHYASFQDFLDDPDF